MTGACKRIAGKRLPSPTLNFQLFARQGRLATTYIKVSTDHSRPDASYVKLNPGYVKLNAGLVKLYMNHIRLYPAHTIVNVVYIEPDTNRGKACR
jgi:hypothetical protein